MRNKSKKKSSSSNDKRRAAAAARAKRAKDQQSANGREETTVSSSRREDGGATTTTNKTTTITSRAAAVGSSLIHVGIVWAICAGLALSVQRSSRRASSTMTTAATTTTQNNNTNHSPSRTTLVEFDDGNNYRIPIEMLRPWTEYPNPLNLTDDDRQQFHPVVKFPHEWQRIRQQTETVSSSSSSSNTNERQKKKKKKQRKQKVFKYVINDHTNSLAEDQLATNEERMAKNRSRYPSSSPKEYSVGRYDERRPSMYASDMLNNHTRNISGYAGIRTVHIGIDLAGPLRTKVYAFADGIVHSVGYNDELGDYGNVIVLEHDLGITMGRENNENGNGQESNRTRRVVWALYGHLDNKSIVNKSRGKRIRKGQMIGRMGDIHENGGWFSPHVHFQLSLEPPDTHDMPGIVSMEDRPKALIQYPDPRQVLGPLY